MLSFLSLEEKEKIVELFMRKGVETILYLLDEDNLRLMNLDYVVKEKFLAQHSPTKAMTELNYEQAKECGTDNEEHTYAGSLASNKKQAV